MAVVLPGKHFANGAYDILGHLGPGLIVDAGAAAGHITKRALTVAGPGSRAIAFEPFPGNWPLIENTLSGLPVEIVRSALGSKCGEAKFFIETTKDTGYSSLGYIVNPTTAFTRIQHIVRRLRSPKGQMITVPVTTIDAHVSERVAFMKIDVQGGEIGVLNGATAVFDRGVDTLQIEFSGELDVLKFLFDRGYVVFDGQYTIVPRVPWPDLSEWNISTEFKLTTGRRAFRGWPKAQPADANQYCAFLRRQLWKVGSVWTDIIAVRGGLAPSLHLSEAAA